MRLGRHCWWINKGKIPFIPGGDTKILATSLILCTLPASMFSTKDLKPLYLCSMYICSNTRNIYSHFAPWLLVGSPGAQISRLVCEGFHLSLLEIPKVTSNSLKSKTQFMFLGLAKYVLKHVLKQITDECITTSASFGNMGVQNDMAYVPSGA